MWRKIESAAIMKWLWVALQLIIRSALHSMLCYLHESIQAGCHCHCKYKQTEFSFHFICRPQSYRTDYRRQKKKKKKIGGKVTHSCSWSSNKREFYRIWDVYCWVFWCHALTYCIYQTNKLICSYVCDTRIPSHCHLLLDFGCVDGFRRLIYDTTLQRSK